MDQLTGALFVGASFASSLIASKNQARIESANIKLQVEQTRLQAAEMAYERTKSFRQNISTNLALSGMGFGGTGGFKGVLTGSQEAYGMDVAAIGRNTAFAIARGQAATAQSKANRFKSFADASLNAAALAGQLGLFSQSPVKGKK